MQVFSGGAPSCISVFAGRTADTGLDAVPHVEYFTVCKPSPTASQAIPAQPPTTGMVSSSPRSTSRCLDALRQIRRDPPEVPYIPGIDNLCAGFSGARQQHGIIDLAAGELLIR